MQTEKLSVVHEDDIATLMSSLGILNKVNDGRIKCKFCQRKTSADNIHSIFPEAGSIKIVCDKPECILELSTYLTNKNA